MKRHVEVGWSWRFRVNSPSTLRERLALLLVKLAQRVSGADAVLMVHSECQPLVPMSARRECIRGGLMCMQRLLQERATAAAVEIAMERSMPWLVEHRSGRS